MKGLCLAAFLLVSLCFPFSAPGFHLSDADQDLCYDEQGYAIECPFAGESLGMNGGRYFRPQPAYCENRDGTITDLNTGLVWQQSTADVNADGMIVSADELSWQGAFAYCDRLAYAGRLDWRIPSRAELLSLQVNAPATPAFDPIFDCHLSYYWSGSSYEPSPVNAWGVDFHNGQASFYGRENFSYVLCVRGGPEQPAPIAMSSFWPAEQTPFSDPSGNLHPQQKKQKSALSSARAKVWTYAPAPKWSFHPKPDPSVKRRPETVQPKSPSGRIVLSSPTFSWSLEEEAAGYQLWINNTSGNILRDWFPAGEICDFKAQSCSVRPQLFLPRAEYTWWVRGWNEKGYGEWSNGLDFKITHRTPPH